MTITASPRRASAVPSYVPSTPEPMTHAPPWIHTSTGLRRPSSTAGLHTFNVNGFDYGAAYAGLNDNFAWSDIRLGLGNSLFLCS